MSVTRSGKAYVRQTAKMGEDEDRLIDSDSEDELTEEKRAEKKTTHEYMLKLKEKSDKRKRVRQKMEAFLWVSAMSALLYYGDGNRNFFSMLLKNTRLNRFYLNITYVLLGLNTSIFLFLNVWLNWIKGNTLEWEVAAPWSIPAATLTGLATAVTIMVALWPVYSWLTPVVQFTLFMGMLLSGHFYPSFLFGGRKQSTA